MKSEPIQYTKVNCCIMIYMIYYGDILIHFDWSEKGEIFHGYLITTNENNRINKALAKRMDKHIK
jgi:hypothetical protein